MTQNLRCISKSYQFFIYGLLALVIGFGATLSLLMAKTTNDIRAVSGPLFYKKLSTLHHLSDYKNALLLHQLALNKYFAYSIDHNRFTRIERNTQQILESNYDFVRQDLSSSSDMEQLKSNYLSLIGVAPQLEKAMAASPVQWNKARALLIELNIKTNQVRSQIDKLIQGIDTDVAQAGKETNNYIKSISTLVHLYSLFAPLAALFVIYHIWARLRSENELAFQASHDPLTGLPHRWSFERRLHSLASTSYLVLIVKVDRFERVTVGLGRRLGDLLLQQIAERIHQNSREAEIFRLDGATYAILYQADERITDFDNIRTALQLCMQQPFQISRHEVYITVSMASVACPSDGIEPSELLKKADSAMQAVQKEGGGDYLAYSNTLSIQTQERIDIEAKLSHAVEMEELELYYQPQLCLHRNSLVGFEALLRWRHDGELISPAQFIPIAEESGLIIPIGDWILTRACYQAKLWNQGTEFPIVVAVNISPRQFRHPHFLNKVKNILADTGVNPQHIELEITEGVVMHDGDETIKLLHKLRLLGLKLAVDDFGTGYSSLAYLKRFPIAKLKIDKAFVQNLLAGTEDATIVQAIINLAHNLGMRVIAEGVETAEQQHLLWKWNCDEAQGYAYGKPLPVGQASMFIDLHSSQHSFIYA
jgi:diguanylate cyclase (GGDEF)-like protein